MKPTTTAIRMNWRRLALHACLALGGTTLLLWLYPVNIGLLRLYFVVAIPTLFIGATAWLWRRKRLRYVPLLLFVITLIVLIMPGRDQNPPRLRERYVVALRAYEGTRYVWGGENGFGIDCSGLVRKALMNAHAREWVSSLNSSHLRDWLELWWYDCSARALKQGYRDWTHHRFDAASVNVIPHGEIAPGDLAVTADGVHVLAYLGRNQWIEADPGLGKVFLARVPVRDNLWFEVPVSVIRWRRLEF